MIPNNAQCPLSEAGGRRPSTGVSYPRAVRLAWALGHAALALGCGSQDEDRNLPPAEVGLTKDVQPVFDDGQSQLYEVKRGLQFPIVEPDTEQAAALGKDVEPYGRTPWITNQDVKVQLTWTLSNLDDAGHTVEILVDPWNEFGRYFPGLQLTDAEDGEFEPNSSGIDHYYVLEGKGAGEASRRHGTFTFADMDELATDFATVQAMIKDPPPPPNGAPQDPDGMTDSLPVYVNHAFNFQNRSYNDVLVAPYIPRVIAGLTGIDFGFRTGEPATVALEIAIELVDSGKGRVEIEGESRTLLKATSDVVTVGSPVPAAM